MKQKPCNYFAYIYLYFRIIRKKNEHTTKKQTQIKQKNFFSLSQQFYSM